MTQSPDITAKSWAMIAALGLIWGATFMVIELALPGITPFWLAAGRIVFAALLTTGIWIAFGAKWTSGAKMPMGPLLTVGVLSSALPFMAISWGQQFVTSGFTGVSMASVALIVLPLAHVMIPGEQMTLRKTIGFGLGFLGVVLLIGPGAFQSTGQSGELLGRLACVFAAGCYALSSVMMRRLPAVDPIGLSAVTLIIGAVPTVGAAIVVEGPPPLPSPYTLGLVALLGLVPTAFANLLRVLVIRSAGPTFMSLTNYQVPVWSILLGAVFLAEPLPPSLLVALVLILAGLALSQWGSLKRLFAR